MTTKNILLVAVLRDTFFNRRFISKALHMLRNFNFKLDTLRLCLLFKVEKVFGKQSHGLWYMFVWQSFYVYDTVFVHVIWRENLWTNHNFTREWLIRRWLSKPYTSHKMTHYSSFLRWKWVFPSWAGAIFFKFYKVSDIWHGQRIPRVIERALRLPSWRDTIGPMISPRQILCGSRSSSHVSFLRFLAHQESESDWRRADDAFPGKVNTN